MLNNISVAADAATLSPIALFLHADWIGRGVIAGLLGASIIAAVCPNAGQLAAAAVLTGTGAVLGYAPALLIFSLITGAVTGTVLRIVMPALEKQTRFIIKK